MFSCIKRWLCSPFKKQSTPVFDDIDPNYDYVDHAIRNVQRRLNKEESLRRQLFAHLGYTVFGGTVMETKDANKLAKKGIEPYED